MPASVPNCTLVYPGEFDERAQWEHDCKGHLYNAIVRLDDGARYRVSFMDPVRLSQEVEDAISRGEVCYLEPALVVIPEVTPAAITKALPELVRQRFFEHLKPISE